MKYSVDCMLPDYTWRYGSILWPASDALAVAASLRAEHPDWLVEVNPVETAQA